MSLNRTLCRALVLAAALLALCGTAQAQPRDLEIIWIDTEGGAATLFIAPSGESMLIDTGYPDNDRDATRIWFAFYPQGPAPAAAASSHNFLYGHHHWPQVKRAILLESKESPWPAALADVITRIADHATNIAEDVIYLVEGDIIRHSRRGRNDKK